MTSWQYQRGGAATPRQWLVIALLVAGIASAAMNLYHMRHKCIEIALPPSMLPTTTIKPPEAEFGVIHIFPEGYDVCTFANAICWTKI